jgi:S-adenosylmethionine:tRNA ribosyltransferase-isomerase
VKSGVRAADFDYFLPDNLIAQHPAPDRDRSRLLVFPRPTGPLTHRQFRDLPEFLREGDLLVLNNSRVIPARLRAIAPGNGRQFEILLLEENGPDDWWAMMRPARYAPAGSLLTLCDPKFQPTRFKAEVLETNVQGHRRLSFSMASLQDVLEQIGETPLPPYIQRDAGAGEEDRARYQTVYARDAGSVAAPTAGLHFTDRLLDELRGRGVQLCHVTLHVGAGTFAPVKAERVEDHTMHHERFHVPVEAANMINDAKAGGRRVVAVGTTSVRVLESVAREHHGRMAAGPGRTNIFIYPPFRFQVVDALITNFHLPRSTLLMLVSALAAPGETAGRQMILSAYETAVKEQYRFFSYGDAMLIL